MNEDIKEILNYMKQYVENKYEHDSEPMLNWKDIQCVLNYITNLQKENQSLKNELKSKPDNEITLETKEGQIMTIIQSERIDMQEKLNKSLKEMYKKYQDYKSKNEKGIEKIVIKQARLINEKDYVITDLDLDEIMQTLESGE